MSPQEILKYISPKFQVFVSEQGWIPVAGRYDDMSFGNAFVDIDAGSFMIRVIKDRSQYFIEIGLSLCDRRFDLVTFLKFFDFVEPSTVDLPTLGRLDAIQEALSGNSDFISRLSVGDALEKSGFCEFYARHQSDGIEQLREKSRLARLDKSKK